MGAIRANYGDIDLCRNDGILAIRYVDSVDCVDGYRYGNLLHLWSQE
jgi:hypothetical protein